MSDFLNVITETTKNTARISLALAYLETLSDLDMDAAELAKLQALARACNAFGREYEKLGGSL